MKNRGSFPVAVAAGFLTAMSLAGGCEIGLPQLAASALPSPTPSARPGQNFVGGIGLLGNPGQIGGGIGRPDLPREVQEPPLPIGGNILPLFPSPESTSSGVLYFSKSSQYFLWVDSAQDHIWASGIGGGSQILAKSGPPAWIDWSADGTYVAVSQSAEGPAQLLRLPPGQDADAVGFGDGVPGRLLPDVSGTWGLNVVQRGGSAAAWPTPGPFSTGNPFKLTVRPVGGVETTLLTLEAQSFSTTSRSRSFRQMAPDSP